MRYHETGKHPYSFFSLCMLKMSSWAHHDAGLVFLRLALGLPFVAHGLQKLGSMDQTIHFFATLGLPGPCAWGIALLELIGGCAVLFGLGLKWASGLLAINMFFAILLVKGKMGFFGGYEFDLVLFLLALGLAFSGAGMCSVDAKLGKGKTCGACENGSCAVHKA